VPSDRRPSLPYVVFATVAGDLFLLIGSVLLAALTLLVSWIPPRGSWVTVICRLWARLLLTAGCVRVEAHSDPALDPEASYVFLANHQSMFDIPALFVTVPGPIRMLAKRSLFRIPIFGWARGGFLLALKSGLPIVPVGIRGTRAIQPKGNWAIRPGAVTVRFGAPIDPAAFGVRRKGALIGEVRRQVADLAGLRLPEG
jgi:1-acyl-sn-glycerol-3-phosphate acyltransferase